LAAVRSEAETLSFSDLVVSVFHRKVIVLPRHVLAPPGQTKSGTVLGQQKTGEEPGHTKTSAAPGQQKTGEEPGQAKTGVAPVH
jgi:hypothetical protein